MGFLPESASRSLFIGQVTVTLSDDIPRKVVTGSWTSNEPQRWNQSTVGQDGKRSLVGVVELGLLPGRTEQCRDHTVSAGGAPNGAAVAVDEHVRPYLSRIRPEFRPASCR